MLRRIIPFVLAFFSLPALGQVSFQFIPELQGRNVDGLLNVKFVSTQASRRMSLSVIVTELKSGKVLSIKTPAFSVNQGVNQVPVTAIRPAKVQFGGSKVATTVQQSGLLPEGEYEYCFALTPEQGYYDPEVPAEQCFTAEVIPFSPLSLIEPGNQDKLCEKRPLFSWQPSFPIVAGSSYQLLLTEIKGNQSPLEALNYNLPIVNQSGIMSPVLPYPPSARELQAGKKYAWQVSLYKNQTVLNRSEVWDFMVDCKDSVENKIAAGNNFRNIGDLSNGNFHEVKGYLKFTLNNPYKEQDMHYNIVCITDPAKKIKRLPKVLLKNGVNQIAIDISNNGFSDGYFYILSVELPNGDIKSLRFVYHD